MELQELKALVTKGEGQRLEFKRQLPEPYKLMREAVAFANSGGGLILIGVDDDGSVPGLKDPHEAEELFEAGVKMLCTPPVPYTHEIVWLNRKRAVIVFRIQDSALRPHQLISKEDGGSKEVLIRIEDRSVTASTEMYQLLKRAPAKTGVKVEFREKERILMEYLHQHTGISVREFMNAASIPRVAASRTLVHLVRANILRIEPGEGEDRFYAIEG